MRPIRPGCPFSPLAPGSPRRPGKPGGPCRRRRERRGEEEDSEEVVEESRNMKRERERMEEMEDRKRNGGLNEKAVDAKNCCSKLFYRMECMSKCKGIAILQEVQVVLSVQQVLEILAHPETQLAT